VDQLSSSIDWTIEWVESNATDRFRAAQVSFVPRADLIVDGVALPVTSVLNDVTTACDYLRAIERAAPHLLRVTDIPDVNDVAAIVDSFVDGLRDAAR